MEIDYDYLRTGTAIGFRASRELFSNYLLLDVLTKSIVSGNITVSYSSKFRFHA